MNTARALYLIAAFTLASPVYAQEFQEAPVVALMPPAINAAIPLSLRRIPPCRCHSLRRR